jgi:hypothetical protein
VASSQTLLPGSEEFAETCVHAARTSSKILGQLQSGRDLAFYGFFDALTVFSSALILMMSLTVQFKAQPTDDETVEKLRRLLQEMRDAGNMSARDYYQELMECKDHLDRTREQINRASNDLSEPSRQSPGPDQALDEQMNAADPGGFDTSYLLMDPQLQAIVQDQNVSWDLNLLDIYPDVFANGYNPWMGSGRDDFGFH